MSALHHALEQRVSASLNAQIQNTLHVLNLGAVDLIQMIHDQCERNPFLELEYPSFEGQNFGTPFQGKGSRDHENADGFEHQAEPLSIDHDLMRQIDAACFNTQERRIAFFLLENLDEHGYLKIDLSYAAFDLSVTRSQVYEVLKILQTFEPAGVFARHIQDVLALQLKHQGLLDAVAEDIIQAISSYDPHAALKQSHKRSACSEHWKRTCLAIQNLTTKPLESYNTASPHDYIIPDLRLHTYGDTWIIQVNESLLPRVHAQDTLYHTLRAQTRTAQDKTTLKGLWSHAQSLTRSLKQRHQLLIRVGELIFNTQQDFLTHGTQGLHPLTLQDIADALSMNISTVSRAVHGKFIQTPQGTYPLKFFFRHGVGEHTHLMTAPYIQEQIQTLIRHENPKNPLSDQDIVDCLKQSNVDIARRTVQKYRELMRIPNRSMRRRIWSM